MKPIFREYGNDWMKGRGCEEHPEFFFPQYDSEGNDVWLDQSQARMICAQCPVKTRCIDYATLGREPDGIWGGMDPDEINKMRLRSNRTLPFLIQKIEPVIDDIVDGYMFAQEVLRVQSSMQVVQGSGRAR